MKLKTTKLKKKGKKIRNQKNKNRIEENNI
jgi:hypothetical protein